LVVAFADDVADLGQFVSAAVSEKVIPHYQKVL